MSKKLLSLLMTVFFMAIAIPSVAMATGETTEAEDTYVVSGELIPEMSGYLSSYSSFEKEFSVPVDATVTFDFTGSTSGSYWLYVRDIETNEVLYRNLGNNSNGVPYSENTVMDIPAGDYKLQVSRMAYGSFYYTFSARYERVYTVDDPYYYISPDPATKTVYVDKPVKFKVKALPEAAEVPEATWSVSKSSVAEVSDGKVTGLKSGTVTLTAKVDGQKVSSSVKVVAPTYSELEDFSIYVGKTKKLSISVKPSDYPVNSIKWKSSNTSVATVTSKGTVKGVKAGTATITGTINGTKIKCKVTVKPITLNTTSKKMEVGDTYTLKLKGGSGKVTWTTSSKSVATVSSSGKVTAKKAGTATITAKVNGNKVTCKITVKPITLNKTSKTMEIGDTYTLKIKDGSGKVTWTSSKKSVATVSSSGKVTAKKAGTATITAKIGANKVTCKITVKPMTLNKTSKTLTTDETFKLKVNGGTGKIKWSSSNSSVAKVSSSGTVTPKKAGTATITAKRDGKTLKCKITVKWAPENGIVKTKKYDLQNGTNGSMTKELVLKGKSTVTITCKVKGDDSLYIILKDEDGYYEWSEFVYEDSGKVTKKLTLSAGTYELYMASDSDINVSVKTVTKPQIIGTTKYVGLKYTTKLKVAGVKNGGTWSSSDKSIATVSSKGVVKGMKKGTCTIYYKMKDGEKISYKITVTNPVTISVESVSDTSILNECDVKFTNRTNKTIKYIEFNIKQYNYKGSRVYGIYDYFYCDYEIKPGESLTLEYWVDDQAKTCTAYIMQVAFTDGTYWRP